jgi:hypothetical protein
MHAVLFVDPVCGVRRQVKFTGQIAATGKAQKQAVVQALLRPVLKQGDTKVSNVVSYLSRCPARKTY